MASAGEIPSAPLRLIVRLETQGALARVSHSPLSPLPSNPRPTTSRPAQVQRNRTAACCAATRAVSALVSSCPHVRAIVGGWDSAPVGPAATRNVLWASLTTARPPAVPRPTSKTGLKRTTNYQERAETVPGAG